MNTSDSTSDRSSLMIWVAHTSASVAAGLAQKLQHLDVAVRLWDESSTLASRGRGLLIADSASFTRIAEALERHAETRPSAEPKRGGLAPGALRRVKAHIEDSLTERIELRELARLAELSQCHFSRAFRQSVGVPPHRYVLSRRIAYAAILVADTDRALTDIALSAGFSDHSHFTRSFVRILGETPRSYRRRHR